MSNRYIVSNFRNELMTDAPVNRKHRSSLLWVAMLATLYVLCSTTARADSVTTRCNHTRYTANCTTTYSEDVAPPKLTFEELQLIEAREQVWKDACKPRVVTGDDGISRYQYEHKNCDIGHLK